MDFILLSVAQCGIVSPKFLLRSRVSDKNTPFSPISPHKSEISPEPRAGQKKNRMLVNNAPTGLAIEHTL